MTNYRQILRLHSQGISGRGIAASCQCSRNTVAQVLERAMLLEIKWPLEKALSDGELQLVLFPEKEFSSDRKIPDCEYLHRELAKGGVTLSLLWAEYCEGCRMSGDTPLMYSQFCRYYKRYAQTTKATMHITRKPGEQIEIDWAGQTASIINNITGEVITAYVFVGVLSSSQYAYVEAFPSMSLESWIAAHVNMFRYFGGVSRILVPDNLKTGITRVSWYTPVINKTYNEMAEYYDTAVIPARVKAPKDKPNAEGAVGVISTWITAALRNDQFFSFYELNQSIKVKLQEYNDKPFQKKEGCRTSVFLGEEKAFLIPLPATPYELATWKVATVLYNYCISIDKMHYSVPYEYIKQKVDIRITRNIIEVFFKGCRICSHPRLSGYPGQYSIIDAHMPESHQKYGEWNGKRFIQWAETIGSDTTAVIKSILSSYKVEQQGYKSCMALLKLGDKYSVSRLEAACKKSLVYSQKPGYQSVKTILQTGHDKVEEVKKKQTTSSSFGFTRGAEYYGRKDK